MNHTTNPQDAKAEALLLHFAAEAHRRKWSYDRGLDDDGVPIKSEAFDALHRLGEEMRTALEELRRAPAVLPSAVVSADRATLRDRITDTVMPFLLNFSDEESARINAAEVATALLADVPAPKAVCICGHSKQQHFEDACITEITGCNCGDYLEPQDAAEVIDRWRQAALQARTADRATLLREAAEAVFALDYDEMVGEEGAEHLGSVREAWDLGTIDAEQLLRRMAADGPSRVAAEEQPTETQDGEVDADTVAKRAAQVISTMGADIRTLTQERNRYRNAWHNARARASDAEDNVRVVKAETHSCRNCEGIDPDTCLTNPDRTRPAVAERPDTQTREAGA